MNETALPCGCIPGKKMCPEAELLDSEAGWWRWQIEALTAEGKHQFVPGMQEEYDKAMAKLAAHMQGHGKGGDARAGDRGPANT